MSRASSAPSSRDRARARRRISGPRGRSRRVLGLVERRQHVEPAVDRRRRRVLNLRHKLFTGDHRLVIGLAQFTSTPYWRSVFRVGSATRAPKRALPPALAANLWQPGQSGNPSGHSGEYGEAMRLARQAAPDAVRRLIELTHVDSASVVRLGCRIDTMKTELGTFY